MKGFLRSKPVLTLAALIMIAAAVIIPLSGAISHSHAAAPAFLGKLWVTGHDADLHCSIPGGGNQCPYFKVAVNFVRNGAPVPSLPLLILDHIVTGGEVEAALQIAFSGNVPRYQIVDPRTGFTRSAVPLVTKKGNPIYSAIIVASDTTCGGCDNNEFTSTPDSDAINARAADIAQFFNAGGGILALAAQDHIGVYYNFLPIPVTAIPVTPPNGAPGGFALTSVGKSLGLTSGDVNCCQTHNSFQLPASGSPLQVAETDSAGKAETLIATNSALPPSPTPTPNRQKLFVFLQGIDTTLSRANILGNETPDFSAIYSSIQTQFPHANFLPYSYDGVDSNGQLQPYGCESTFTQSLKKDVFNLDDEITAYLSNHSNTDVYLVGHSLGGVVAFGYLAYLNRLPVKFSLPYGGKLAGVINLDSPIGGITGDTTYLGLVVDRARSNCNPGLSSVQSVKQLVALFQTAHSSHPLGGSASLEEVLFGGKGLSNEQLANEAAHNGIPVLTVGNLRDFLWDTQPCSFPLPNVDFRDTQWLQDEAPSTAVYGRDFKGGDEQCTANTILFHGLNHFEVLTNSQVIQGIAQFLPNGGVPNKLDKAPSNP